MTTEKSGERAGERIAKRLARAGLCSRREAEVWIAEGRVTVNGKTISTPALNVDSSDYIKVNGQVLQAADPTRLWLYHKPKGLLVSTHDPEGRPTIFEQLPDSLPRVMSVGRLDFNTEGLLLLTNSGALKRHLELPTTGWVRKYRVRAFGKVDAAALGKLQNGITVDGVKYGPIEAILESSKGHNSWLQLALREGKNREIRNVLAAVGLEVNRLLRISYGPFQLGKLDTGQVSEVTTRVLKEQLGAVWDNL